MLTSQTTSQLLDYSIKQLLVHDRILHGLLAPPELRAPLPLIPHFNPVTLSNQITISRR